MTRKNGSQSATGLFCRVFGLAMISYRNSARLGGLADVDRISLLIDWTSCRGEELG